MRSKTVPDAISVVTPTLNEAGIISDHLTALQPLRTRGHELIVVDGGSTDGTQELAAPLVDRLIVSAPGRALQMNAGAAAARGDVLLFLHADTHLPPASDRLVLERMRATGRTWGRFDVRLTGRHPLLRFGEQWLNTRSRWTGIATGDQAIFVARWTFEALGGYPKIPLMEDVALSKTLRTIGPPLCLRTPALTSSRRWEEHGILRTAALMCRLRYAYWRGADPAHLAELYRRG